MAEQSYFLETFVLCIGLVLSSSTTIMSRWRMAGAIRLDERRPIISVISRPVL
jgi:hypothetical protein